MRLGCEATAIDINPVAWFILKCTLEYPQKLAGQVRPLPKFALESPEFMEAFLKGSGKLSKNQAQKEVAQYQQGLFPPPEADLAWHVRAWGWWVLQQARKDLERFYPTIDGKPSVAYLWARTVTCKNCRATIPLLKTRWLCKKDDKRIVLTMEPNADKTGVVLGIQNDLPVVGGNVAQKREHDKRLGAGTMSRSGAACPCCSAIMKGEDIRYEGQSGRLRQVMTAAVYESPTGKEYRLPTKEDILAFEIAQASLKPLFDEIPFDLPLEPVPRGASRVSGGSAFSIQPFGVTCWHQLFNTRQLIAIGTFIKYTREATRAMLDAGYDKEWSTSISSLLALAVDRLADRGSTVCSWTVGWDKIRNTFTRFALPYTWDYAESVPISDSSGGYPGSIDWISRYVEHASRIAPAIASIKNKSAIAERDATYDLILTDPPYYDAIPYADLMDFFYVWLRRSLFGLSSETAVAFSEPLSPKWSVELQDGELVDDSGRHNGDRKESKKSYEDGMSRAFASCHEALMRDGRLVIVFAHKQPDAWETLVGAIIRSGFVVDASWPIQTEMANRTRALASAALSSSVWLVCRKRPETARPGWDNRVLEETCHRLKCVSLRCRALQHWVIEERTSLRSWPRFARIPLRRKLSWNGSAS